MPNNIIMADQPSGFGILASGTYTQASSTSSMTIPVSYTGNPVFYVVRKSEQSGTWAWILARYDLATDIYSRLYPWNVMLNDNAYSSNSHQSNNLISATDSAITCKQRDSNYPVIAGDYTWEIWGVR